MFRSFIFIFFVFAHPLFASSRACVAVFPNNETGWSKEGKLIGDALQKAHISWDGGGSRGFAVNVDQKDELHARYVIAELMLSHTNLHITLTKTLLKEDKWIQVSPERALREYDSHKAEQGAAANP